MPYRTYLTLIASVLLALSLTACCTPRVVTQVEREYVCPPQNLMEPRESPPPLSEQGEVVWVDTLTQERALYGVIDLEQADKAEIRRWCLERAEATPELAE